MSATPPPSATQASLLTPAGRGAVAVVRVSGPLAVAAVDACFRAASGRALAEQLLGAVRFGRWLEPDGEEVVVCVRAERDARPAVEVHCHGGRAAAGAILASLRDQGCVETPWKSVVEQAARSRVVAEAESALRMALTERAAGVLLDQAEGAMDAALRGVLRAASAQDAVDQIDEVLRWREFGARLTRPWRVVLAGAPNVGKSSLINAIVGYARSIVFEQPGTTRDVVTAMAAVDGWPVVLSDTAGVRETDDASEAAGVRLARAALARADLVLDVRDASDASSARALAGVATKRRVEVLNKIDLAPHAAPSASDSGARRVATCAVSGEGVPALLVEVARQLVPHPPPSGAAVPVGEAQADALRDVRRDFERGDVQGARALVQSLLSPPERGLYHP